MSISEEMMTKAVAAARKAADESDIPDPYSTWGTGYVHQSPERQAEMLADIEDWNNEAWEYVLRAAIEELGL